MLDSTCDKDKAVPSSLSPILDTNNNGGRGGGHGGGGGTNPEAMVGICDDWFRCLPSTHRGRCRSHFFSPASIVTKKEKGVGNGGNNSDYLDSTEDDDGTRFHIGTRRCTKWIIPMMVSNTEDEGQDMTPPAKCIISGMSILIVKNILSQ